MNIYFNIIIYLHSAQLEDIKLCTGVTPRPPKWITNSVPSDMRMLTADWTSQGIVWEVGPPRAGIYTVQQLRDWGMYGYYWKYTPHNNVGGQLEDMEPGIGVTPSPLKWITNSDPRNMVSLLIITVGLLSITVILRRLTADWTHQ